MILKQFLIFSFEFLIKTKSLELKIKN